MSIVTVSSTAGAGERERGLRKDAKALWMHGSWSHMGRSRDAMQLKAIQNCNVNVSHMQVTPLILAYHCLTIVFRWNLFHSI